MDDRTRNAIAVGSCLYNKGRQFRQPLTREASGIDDTGDLAHVGQVETLSYEPLQHRRCVPPVAGPGCGYHGATSDIESAAFVA
jgi:hypothetical protein